jgi:hypothetical protein
MNSCSPRTAPGITLLAFDENPLVALSTFSGNVTHLKKDAAAFVEASVSLCTYRARRRDPYYSRSYDRRCPQVSSDVLISAVSALVLH